MSLPALPSASTARGSIAAPISRLLTRSSRTTWCGAVERLAHGGFIAPREAKADVARRGVMQLRRVLCHRRAAIDDDRQRLVVHLREDQRRPAPAAACLGNDRGNGFADMPHRAARQRPARRLGHRLAIRALDGPKRRHGTDLVGGHIGAGEHGDDAGERWPPSRCRCCGFGRGRAASAPARNAIRRADVMSAT